RRSAHGTGHQRRARTAAARPLRPAARARPAPEPPRAGRPPASRFSTAGARSAEPAPAMLLRRRAGQPATGIRQFYRDDGDRRRPLAAPLRDRRRQRLAGTLSSDSGFGNTSDGNAVA